MRILVVLLAVLGSCSTAPPIEQYRDRVYTDPLGLDLQRLLVAIRDEEPNITRDDRPGATADDKRAAQAAAARCNKIEESLLLKVDADNRGRIAAHLMEILQESEQAWTTEIYLFEALGRLLDPDAKPPLRIEDRDWKPFCTTLLAKSKAARRRWSSPEILWLYLGLEAEVMSTQYRDAAALMPPVPNSDAPDFLVRIDAWFEWVRPRVAKH